MTLLPNPVPPPLTPLSLYRGRLAPSPTGLLHLGHGRTFWTTHERCRERLGTLVLRLEDLDASRCREEFADAALEDLRWMGLRWQEGPDCGGPHAPYLQSQRLALYREHMERLKTQGWLYPCRCSRKDILNHLAAPHTEDEQPIYPGTCRPTGMNPASWTDQEISRAGSQVGQLARPVWRFCVPSGEVIHFDDVARGQQRFVAGKDFGDFVVWTSQDLPSYQLAVVVDDALMQITEVVRGADLLLSTARQLLLYRALGWAPPQFYHCPLVLDDSGRRLSKRHDALSLRSLREKGNGPEAVKTASNHQLPEKPGV